MNYSYKSFKHYVLIAFGLFFILSVNSLNAQTFYSTDRCIDILKNETLVLESEIQSNQHGPAINMNKALVNYYGALITYWADKLATNSSNSNGSDISYAVNHYLFILYNNADDSVDGFAPLSKAQSEQVRNNTLGKLSH